MWIQECASSHTECGVARRKPLPTRVLDVRHDLVRLYDTQGERVDYVTLSHCWGASGNNVTTTTRNYEDRKSGIEWGVLNKTYQEAVIVVRRIGINFLWIDSLCIVQDNASDWNKESGQIASIYENSFLTICATRSKDGTGGLFNVRYAEGSDCRHLVY